MGRSAQRRGCRLLLLVWLLILPYPGRSPADDDQEIFHWVARHMKIDNPGRMPQILYVSRDRLGMVFEKNNRRSYLRWRARYGELQARKILTLCLRNILGLYDPDTGTVYVAEDLVVCQQRSILAHELAHFLQYQSTSTIKQPESAAYAQRLQRETQAHQIEYLYLQSHCPAGTVGKAK